MALKKIVVTGIGAFSPLAGNAPETWAALLAGKSGVRTMEMEGEKVTIFAAGSHKADGNPFGPLPPEVATAFQARIDSASANFCAYVAEMRGKPVREIRRFWLMVQREADLPDVRIHDLRHTCASYLAQNGATLLEIGDVLGHRNLSVTKRYSHLATSHKSALINRVLGEIS